MLYNIIFHPYETDVAEQLRGYTLLYIIKRAVLVDDVEGQKGSEGQVPLTLRLNLLYEAGLGTCPS